MRRGAGAGLVWVEIRQRGNMQALAELERIHKAEEDSLFTPAVRVAPPPKGRSALKTLMHVLMLDRMGNYLGKLMLSGFTRFYAYTIRKYKNAQDIRA